jgi:hypothetical protein
LDNKIFSSRCIEARAGVKTLICCHKFVSSWVFFSETGLYAVLFQDETRVAMLFAVELSTATFTTYL